MTQRGLPLVLCAAAVLVLSSASPAPEPPGLTIAQLQYDGGGDWYANPSGVNNLLAAIRTRTGLPVAGRGTHVRITDPALWSHPFLYLTGHGNIRLSAEEVEILRRYLLQGGFLHADDNYGLDESFRREVRRIFPDRELVELPADHPIYRSVYAFPDGLPKIHKHDGKRAQGLGIFERGRLVLFYTYESDLGNGWEDADRYGDPEATREAAVRMGVNIFTFALAQAAS
jgi:hypothetical protein